MAAQAEQQKLILPYHENYLTSLLDDEKRQDIKKLIAGFHPADAAQLVQSLSYDQRISLFEVLEDTLNPEILVQLEDSVREDILRVIQPAYLAKILSQLESDDALMVVAELDPDLQRKTLDTLAPDEKTRLEQILAYPEDSAGRLMQREIVAVPYSWDVANVLRHVRSEKKLPEFFYNIVAVDGRYRLRGSIQLAHLLRVPTETLLKDIMQTDAWSVNAYTDQEEVALLFRRYSLVSLPVVNRKERIIGMITIDDIVDVINKEAEEDILHMGGVPESDFYVPIVGAALSRLPWLCLSLVNTLLSSSVIAQFQGAIEKKVTLAILMPIVAAVGGHAGMQALTVTVRALATRNLTYTNWMRNFFKETGISIVTGCFLACLLGAVVAVWIGDVTLGVTLLGALFLNILIAGMIGTTLPLAAQYLRLDPALSSAPLSTAITDMVGYALFLGAATYFLI